MTDNLSTTSRKFLAATLLLLVVVALGSAIILPYLNLKHAYSEELASVEKRIEIYRRSVGVADKLRGQHRRLEGVNTKDKRYLKSQIESLAGAELQGILKRVVKSHGAEVFSTQVLPSEQQEQFSDVSIRVRMKGTMESVVGVIYALESRKPYLFVSALQIRGKRGSHRRSRTFDRKQKIQKRQLDLDFVLSGYMRSQS